MQFQGWWSFKVFSPLNLNEVYTVDRLKQKFNAVGIAMSECVVRNVFLSLELFLQKVAALDIFEALIFNYKIKSSDWLEPLALHFSNVVSEFSKQLEDTLRAFYAHRLVQLHHEGSVSHQLEQVQESSHDSYDDQLAVHVPYQGSKQPATGTTVQRMQSFTCELCSRKFLSVAKLSAHLSRCHRNKESSKCNACETSFSAADELLLHNKAQVQDVSQKFHDADNPSLETLPFLCCRTCLLVHKTVDDFNTHVCVQSSGNLGESIEIIAKQLITSPENLKSLHKYKCGLCREEYRSQRRMIYHLSRCRQGPYSCELCSQEFHFKKDLNQHKKKSHRGLKCFFCDECPLVFKLCTSLQKHKINRHESEQGPFPCDQCSQHFTKKIYLTNHKIRMHKIDRKYLCQVCGHKFSNSNSLNTHLKTHSEKKRFKCSYCKKLFRQKEKLKYHTRIHTGEKPHLCQTCGKSFIRKSQLNDHVLRHQGKKRHHCLECSKTYAGLWDLKQHIKKKHSSPEEPPGTVGCSKQPGGDVQEQQTAGCEEAVQTGKEAGAKSAAPVLDELPGVEVLSTCELPQLAPVQRLLPVVQLGEVPSEQDSSRIIVHLGPMQPLTDTLQLVDNSSMVQVLNHPTYLLACGPAPTLDIPTITY